MTAADRRDAVYAYWGERCFFCDASPHELPAPRCGVSKNGLQLDHLWPKKRGGSDDFVNLVPICPSCNSKKGAKWPGEYMAWRKGCRIDRLSSDSMKATCA